MLKDRLIIIIKLALAFLTLVLFIPEAWQLYNKSQILEANNKIIHFENYRLKAKVRNLQNKVSNLQTEQQIADQVLTPENKETFMNDITTWLKNLQQDFALEDIKIFLSRPSKILNHPYEFYNLIKTQINLKFLVESELETLMFVDEIIEKFPGYIMIDNLEITKNLNEKLHTAVHLSSYSLEEVNSV